MGKIAFVVIVVSTHSRLKAAGEYTCEEALQDWVSTHSRLKAAGVQFNISIMGKSMFQHTAA